MKKSFAFTAVAAALFTIQAGAETTTATNTTSTATVPSSIRENISAVLASFLYGPSVGHITSSFQPDAEGNLDEKSKQSIDNSLIGTYKLNSKTNLSVAANFTYVPVMGQEIILRDPTLKISRSGIIDANGFKLNGSARVYVPVSPGSREKNSLGALRIDPSLSFRPSGSRWSANIIGDYRAKFLGGDVTYMTLTSWTFPHLSYELNGKTSFSFGTEIAAKLAQEELTLDPSNLSAGVSYQILPALNLNPSFSIRPTNLSLDSTQLFLGVTANLL